MPHFDEKLSSGNVCCENPPLASEGPEVVCAERSETAPIALPSDRGLHVYHGPAQRFSGHAPEVCESSPLYSVGDPGTPNPATAVVTNAANSTNSPSEEPLSESTDQRPEKPRGAPLIGGLRRRTFWVVAILLLIIVAGAAIGGGVGGVYATRSQSTSSVSTNSPTSVPTTSSSSSSIISSSTPSPATSPSPQKDFSIQIWSLPAFTGRSQVFSTPGSFQTAFLARSYIWDPGQYGPDTMSVCSVAQCVGSTQLGWRGSGFKKQPGQPQNETWGFDNVVIECMATFMAPSCPSPAALSTFATVPVLESSTSNVTVESATLGSGSATGMGSATGTGTEVVKISSATSSATMTTGL